MIVLKVVPFRGIKHLGPHINYDPILIESRSEPAHISLSQELSRVLNELATFILDLINSLRCDRWVTNALEEFDTFFPFKFLEMPIVLDEVLLCSAYLLVFQ